MFCDKNKALHCHVNLSLGRPPNNQWKRRPGRPRERWIDQVWKDNGIPPADLWRRATSCGHWGARLRPSLALCCSRYTGCQSESASTTKSPLWRSRLVGCRRRHTWIHCWMTTSRHGLSDFLVRRAWSFQERAQNLPSERSPSLLQLYGTVCQPTLLTLTVYCLSKNI